MTEYQIKSTHHDTGAVIYSPYSWPKKEAERRVRRANTNFVNSKHELVVAREGAISHINTIPPHLTNKSLQRESRRR